MIWVRGTQQRPNIIFCGTVLPFPPAHFFFTAVKNDSLKRNKIVKTERNHEKDCLTISSHGWSGKLKTGQLCFLFSHALESILVSAQDNRFCEGELQGDCEITFLSLDREWKHCEGIRQSLNKHLKETDYKNDKIQAPLLTHISAASTLSSRVSTKRNLSSMGDAFCNKRTRLSLDNSENKPWRRLNLLFLGASISSRIYPKVLGTSPSLYS